MITKELIKILQKLVDENEPHLHILGEHEIMIDVFKKNGDLYEYVGFSKDVRIDKSDDGVYDILNAFAQETK